MREKRRLQESGTGDGGSEEESSGALAGCATGEGDGAVLWWVWHGSSWCGGAVWALDGGQAGTWARFVTWADNSNTSGNWLGWCGRGDSDNGVDDSWHAGGDGLGGEDWGWDDDSAGGRWARFMARADDDWLAWAGGAGCNWARLVSRADNDRLGWDTGILWWCWDGLNRLGWLCGLNWADGGLDLDGGGDLSDWAVGDGWWAGGDGVDLGLADGGGGHHWLLGGSWAVGHLRWAGGDGLDIGGVDGGVTWSWGDGWLILITGGDDGVDGAGWVSDWAVSHGWGTGGDGVVLSLVDS